MTAASQRVLVIEDDEDIRALVQSRLRRRGWVTEGAATGEDGLAAAFAEPPAVVVLDIMLPGIDGWEVLRRLREHVATASIQVVVISIMEPDQTDGSPDCYITKPFKTGCIEAAVERLMGEGSTQALV